MRPGPKTTARGVDAVPAQLADRRAAERLSGTALIIRVRDRGCQSHRDVGLGAADMRGRTPALQQQLVPGRGQPDEQLAEAGDRPGHRLSAPASRRRRRGHDRGRSPMPARRGTPPPADIRRGAPPSGGDALEDLPVARFVGLQRRGVVGGDVARRDRVDVDAFGRPLVGEQPCQPCDPALGSGIARHADPALEAQQRGDVDDLAAALCEHVPPGRLAQEEQALEVGVDHRVPVGLGELDRIGAADDAGVVDEDVEAAELGERAVDH
jgi:hypothetical protein